MPDLDSMSRKELETLKKDVDKALSTVSDRERKAAIDAAERAAAEYGYSLTDLANGAVRGSKKSKSKSPAKFRNPENPDETWSGRGRKPRWLVDAESAGRTADEFAVG